MAALSRTAGVPDSEPHISSGEDGTYEASARGSGRHHQGRKGCKGRKPQGVLPLRSGTVCKRFNQPTDKRAELQLVGLRRSLVSAFSDTGGDQCLASGAESEDLVGSSRSRFSADSSADGIAVVRNDGPPA